jgi:PAS domain S-box-containing protein
MALVGARSYLALLLLSVVVSGLLAGFAVKYRERRGATPFAALVGCLLVWSLAEAVGFTTASPAVAERARQLMFVVIPFVPVTVLALAFQYTGREQYVAPTVVGMLGALPTMSALLALTNPWHGLFWTAGELVPVGSYSVYVADASLWYWVHIAYTYALLAVASYLFVRWGLTAGREYRRQSRYLLAGIAFPWGANVATMAGLAPDALDFTPVFFTVSGLCIGIAVFRFRFLDLVPVARDTVVEVMRDSVLVLDEEHRIVDANPAARALLGIDEGELVGRRIDAVAPPALAAVCTEADSETTLTLSTRRGERTFDVRRSALPGGARMVLLYDVTERRVQAEQLERQNERLEEFASVLSHDLRNPLNVAQGYVELFADDAEGEQAEHARRASEALDRMETLVDDTLVLAREGPAVTDPEPVELAEAARSAWRSVDTESATLDVRAELTAPGDGERVKRLFENLFRNSIQHASDGAAVSVEPLADGFAVTDDGPGIPEEKRDEVLEYGFTTDDEGTGLGLSIVSDIAEAHGWRVAVAESEAGGARFEFHGVEPASGRETP